MAGTQQGLEVAFYLYPCGLFATLFVSQAIYYYRERAAKAKQNADPAAASDNETNGLRRFYSILIRALQALLCALYV